MYRSPDFRTLEQARRLAHEEESNVAVGKDGTLETTSRTRPDHVPFKRAIITYDRPDTVRLVTFSDSLRAEWDRLQSA